MIVVIASDHAGYEYKQMLVAYLSSNGFEMVDLGTNSATIPDDYPDHAADAAEALLQHRAERGILICGSAVGVSIAANKFRGIRAGVCHDTYSAHQCVEHDNVNILCLGERVIGIELAKEIALRFLSASFSGEERHERRLHKIELIEQKNMK